MIIRKQPLPRHIRAVTLILTALLWTPLGCGGGHSAPVSVTISTVAVSVPVNGKQAFTAQVQHAANAGVTWRIQEGAAGGSITSDGVYTAPTTAGTYHIIVTSRQDTSKTAVITVTVTLTVAITPPAPTISVRQTVNFAAQITGSANQGVNWAVQEAGGGVITGAGEYTAPSQAGTYHVVAQSAADPAQSASAVVTVQSASAVGTIQ